MRISDLDLIALGAAGLVAGVVTGDWLTGVSIITLMICIRLVWTNDGLFVLPIALSFHWMQGNVGLIYLGLTGREVAAVYDSDWRPMVMIALGCCLAIAAGIRLGLQVKKAPDPTISRPGFAFSFGLLVAAYVVTIILEGTLSAVAPDYPSLRQIITTFDSARLGVLFLILRRLCSPPPRFGLVALVVAIEIVLGITGFFAGFREPIVLAVLAVLEVFDRRNARHWLALAVASVAICALGVLWMGIRGDYRREYVEVDQFSGSRNARINRVEDLTSSFMKNDTDSLLRTTDQLVDRMWTIYYPALALKRVPSVIPHTNGQIVGLALLHIVTPRIFFPNKGELPSDSDEVRKYANVAVAGREVNTSIAFGYSAESYIDFGLPWMFLPVFVYGIFVGACYTVFRSVIWHRELFVSFATVSFWISVYLFERSWATMLGVTVGFMVYLGGPMVLLDRFLLIQYSAKQAGGVGEGELVLTPAEHHRT
jgi:hypothetical protein